MITFHQYFEESLGIKHTHPDGKRKERKQRRQAHNRSEIIRHIAMIKDLLDDMGYVVTQDVTDYTTRKYKVVALSKAGESSYLPKYAYNKKYILKLFTLAHETGHTLQWVGEEQENWSEFFDTRYNLRHDIGRVKELEHLEKVYYELDAWEKGKQFIPPYLYNSYLQHAHKCLATYMDHPLEYYKSVDFLDPLIQKLY